MALHMSARGWSERAFEQKRDVIAKVVMAELVQYGVALADLSASIGAQPEVDAAAFAAITAPMNGERLPGAVAVGFVVPAGDADVAGLQARWRESGDPELTLSPDPAATGEHYFAVLGKSLTGPATVPQGVDLASVAAVASALREARSGGGVVTSATFEPAGGGDRSFVMAAAVRGGEAGEVRGWVVMTFLGREFLGMPVGLIGGEQVDVEFADVSGDRPVTVATWQSGARPDHRMPAWSTVMPEPPGHWRLTVRPTVRLLPAGQAWPAPVAAVAGSLITILLATLTATVVTSRDRALRRVDEATAELRDDIARREAVEQQLRRREEELVGFAGVVAHDLRSPLANVVGYADMIRLLDDGDLSEKQRAHLARLQSSAGRMQALIEDLLAYATADNTTLRSEPVDLGALVDVIVAERRVTAPDAEITRTPLPVVLGDESQIRQVLDNLIGNAVKYTPKDRHARISISATDVTETSFCRVEIADRGIGIPESRLSEVFNAFTRVEGSENYPGTGLGLAIVQRIVERHNGDVGVAGNPGGGTIFWFTLPTAGARSSVP
ncbi:HAMP domain-containing sensor histidine kinase [Actinoplanes sp. NPDC023714]|uniref:sensor histidine kinase n=1 Tax=Actinoplanes sp. NPDC023714 TaxID=3154322 RepID=UPI0033F302C0